MFRLIFLVAALVFTLAPIPAQAQRDIPQPQRQEQHCVVYAQTVHLGDTIPSPEALSSILTQMDIPNPVLVGCYPTMQEALYIGSNGSLSVSESATDTQIKREILYHASTRQGNLRSPTVVALAYDGQSFTGTSYALFTSGGCDDPGNQLYMIPNYVALGHNDNLESMFTASDCDSVFLYEDINYAGQYYNFFASSASFIDPVRGVNLNNEVSSSAHFG